MRRFGESKINFPPSDLLSYFHQTRKPVMPMNGKTIFAFLLTCFLLASCALAEPLTLTYNETDYPDGGYAAEIEQMHTH